MTEPAKPASAAVVRLRTPRTPRSPTIAEMIEATPHHETPHLARWRRLAAIELGGLRLEASERKTFARWAAERAGSPHSGRMIARTVGGAAREYLRLHPDAAVDRGALDVANGIFAREAPRRPPHPRITGEMIGIIRAAWPARSAMSSAAVPFLLHSTIRGGELCRACWRDLERDGPRGTLRILNRKHPQRPFHDRVPLTPAAVAALDEFPWLDRERIFPFTRHSLSAVFRRACRDAGILDVRLHSLRHEGLTRLGELGLDQISLQVVSGHHDVAMLARYSKPTAESVGRRIEALQEAARRPPRVRRPKPRA